LHRSRPFWAGVSLWFCTLKPHLFLPFGIALLLWVIASRTYSVLAGVAAALGVSTAIALMLDPAVWLQYGEMMSAARIDRLAVPCLSTMLRLSISPDAMWLQYLPVAIGCIWAVLYFRRHREDWDWMAHGSLLMLVSVLVASYTWFTDQAILIPAVLHGVYLTRSRGLLATLALASAVIEIGASHGISRVLSEHYLWTAPAWLAWYVVAARGVRSKTVCRSSAMTDAGLVELPVTSGWTAGPEADEAGR
jgi:hypothetical protein